MQTASIHIIYWPMMAYSRRFFLQGFFLLLILLSLSVHVLHSLTKRKYKNLKQYEMEWKPIRIRRHVVTLSPFEVKKKRRTPLDIWTSALWWTKKKEQSSRKVTNAFVWARKCYVRRIHFEKCWLDFNDESIINTCGVIGNYVFPMFVNKPIFLCETMAMIHLLFYRIYTFAHDCMHKCTHYLHEISSHGCGISARIFALIRHDRNISPSTEKRMKHFSQMWSMELFESFKCKWNCPELMIISRNASKLFFSW